MYSGGCVSVCVCSGTGKAMHGDPMYAHTLTHTHVCSPRTSALATVAYSIGLKGCTLPIPTSCPSEITHVLKRCWNLRPRDRPGFAGEAFEAETEAETETETDRDRYCLSVCLSVSLTLTLLTDPPPFIFSQPILVPWCYQSCWTSCDTCRPLISPAQTLRTSLTSSLRGGRSAARNSRNCREQRRCTHARMVPFLPMS